MTTDPIVHASLEIIYELSALGKDRQALNLIYEVLDDLILDGRFDICDLYLEQVDLSRLDTASMLGFLTITSTSRDRLRTWSALYRRIESAYRDRCMPESKVRRILGGFE